MLKSKRGRWLKWFSLPIFILVLIAAYANYHLINRAEDAYVCNTTAHVAEVVQAEIQRVIELPLLVLDRMGRSWIHSGGFTYSKWRYRAQNFLRLFTSAQSIEWIDQNHTIRWVEPYQSNQFLINVNLDQFPGTAHILNQVKKDQSLLLTPVVQLIEGGKGFLTIKGIYDKKNKYSAIAAVFNANKLFHPLLKQSLFQDFSFNIKQNGEILYSRGEPLDKKTAPFSKTITLHMNNVDWLLSVWPSQNAIANMKSTAPQNIFVSGFIIASVLAALFYIAGQKIQLGEESIRTGREIAEATKKNHLILEKANEGFISVDREGKILNWNLYSEKIFGWMKEEVLGKRFQDVLLPKENRAQVIQQIKRYIVSRQSDAMDKKIEITVVNKAGLELPVEMTIFTIFSEGRTTYHAFLHDITERKIIEKMKNEFISVVSHELRTPLTAIKGSISLLLDNDKGDLTEKPKKLLTIAQKNCDRLIELINDILDLEKIESGKFELHNRKFKIMSLVEDAIRANEAYASKYKVKLIINSECNVSILADYDKLMQVLTNLLSNAVKFSKPDSLVTLHVRVQNKQLVLAVEDTGEGIPKSFHHKIFEKFAQADSSSARGKGGTGLGLSICQSIVNMHHGSIVFESVEGVGTTFFVTLPVIVEEDNVQEIRNMEHSEPQHPHAQKKIYILHIEDDPDVSKITQMLLEHEAVVTSATSLEQAKKMLKTHHYDLVILDVALPDGHGAGLLPVIDMKTRQMTPVLVFSSCEIAPHLRQYVSAGLIKSRTSNELFVSTVRKLCASRNHDVREA